MNLCILFFKQWFISYFDVVRDQLQTSKRFKRAAEESMVEENLQERFFLSTSTTAQTTLPGYTSL